MRRRRKAAAEFEESILASQAATTESAPAGEAGASIAESSILSDISQGNLANVRTDEVDPIAEAEVYLAYGRDETAEEILKSAAAKYPQRHELKQKLLEIYAARKDVKAFETLAEELYAAVGGQGKIWEKVEEMGSKISPSNPMFRGAGAKAVTASTVAATPAAAAAPPTEVAPSPTAAIAPETALDFDLGTPAITTSAKEEKSFDLDFDLGEVKPTAPKPPEAAPAPPATSQAQAGADFDFGLDLGAPAPPAPAQEPSFDLDFDLGAPAAEPAKPAAAGEKEKPAAPAGEGFTVDLGEPMTSESVEAALDVGAAPPVGEVQQQQWDEAATKLDLARAYIDMGDADGARSILEEVIAEGSAEQKKQAQDLIAQIR
jgi:pilus assembly protein FimV